MKDLKSVASFKLVLSNVFSAQNYRNYNLCSIVTTIRESANQNSLAIFRFRSHQRWQAKISASKACVRNIFRLKIVPQVEPDPS
jgi:hypothetical protein